MKRKYLLSLFILLLLSSFYYLPTTETTISGHTAGNFSITDGGAATYSIPISIPTGTAGIAPQLAMTYNSQGSNGIMGLGWSLQGLSMISRSDKTLAQDGEIKGIDLSNEDTYSLDGERLIAISGVYGADGTEYRTEQNAFMRIISHGNINGTPQKWTIWTKAGLKMEYGYTDDAQRQAGNQSEIMYWLLNKVEDTNGNYYTITYIADYEAEQFYPTRIDYTGNANAGLLPYNHIEFIYESRPNVMAKYRTGIKMLNTVRLKNISAYSDNQLFREYKLTYQTGQYINASLLSSGQECGADGTCFEPTTFDWSSEGDFAFFINCGLQTAPDNRWAYLGDWNGDGKLGTMLYNPNNAWDTNFYGNTSECGASSDSIQFNIPNYFNDGDIYVTDLNADGFTDVVQYNEASRVNKWAVNTGQPSIRSLSFDFQQNLMNPIQLPAQSRPYLVDFNGDGLTDVFFCNNSNGNNVFYVNTTAAGGTLTFASMSNINALASTYFNNNKEILFLDFSGDGLIDIITIDKTTGTNYWIRNKGDTSFAGENFEVTNTNLISPAELAASHQIRLGDWNGDGLIEFMNYKSSNGATHFFINHGNTFFETITDNLTTVTGTSVNFIAQDFNSDQITDVLMHYSSSGVNRWFLNDGACDFSKPLNPNQPSVAGYTNAVHTLLVRGTPGTMAIADIRYTDEPDIFWQSSENGYSRMVVQGRLKGSPMIETITNGIGANTMIEYQPLTDKEVYTKEHQALYPELDFQGRVPVVRKYKMDNGMGGINEMMYTYKGAKVNLHGRGYRGFTEIMATNMQTMMTETKCYTKDYRYLAIPLMNSETRKADGTLLSHTINANEFTITDFPNQPSIHHSYLTSAQSINYEMDGQMIAEQSMRQEWDEYGNVTLLVMDHGNGFKDSTINFYENRITAGLWQLGRLTRSEVYRMAPNQPTVKRVVSFEYDPVSGLLNKEITEPDLSRNDKIIKTFIRDDFGNIVESHIKAWNGNRIEDRVVFTTYDERGRFVISTQNELGHTETRTYDEALGLPLTVTGPNNRTISNQYDGFGRLTRTDFPDGNWTTVTYSKCGAADCPPDAKYFVHQQASNAPPVKTYYDMLDREIRSETVGFSGTTIFQDRVYNNRGLVEKVSEPYFEGDTPDWICYEYDELNRQTLQTLPGGREFSNSYNGLLNSTTNALGQTKSVLQDVKGRNIQVLDNANNALTYGYDAQDNLISITDPNGNSITQTYDLYNRNIASDDPDMGTYQYDYNMFDELILQIDATGDEITFEYDSLGRLVKQYEVEKTTTWLYDTAPNAIGELATVTTDDGYSQNFTYDHLGRPISTTETIAGETYTTTTTYDALGRVETLTYPSGFAIKNIYNDYHYLVEVRNNATDELYWKAEAVNAQGQLLQESFGNGLTTNYTYDSVKDFLQQIVTSNGIQTVQDMSFTFNDIGHLTQRKDNTRNLTENFQYDNLNRLTDAMVVGGFSLTTQYDILGNITYKSDVGTYSYGENGAGPRTLTSIELDDTSLCILSLTNVYDYTSFNKVKEIRQSTKKLQITYGAGRQRIIQKNYHNQQLLDTRIHVGDHYEKVVTDDLTKEIHYISGGSGVVAVYNKLSNNQNYIEYWHKDHLGSLQVVTDDMGVVQQELSYDAWGKRRNADNWSSMETLPALVTPRGFTGHEHIDNFGLVNMNGRMYNPDLGRFISADPNIQDLSDLQNLNRYAYVLNNPLSYIDPSGYFFQQLWSGVKNFFQNNWKAIATLAVSAVLSVFVMPAIIAGVGLGGTLVGSFLSGAGIGFGSSFTGSLLAGAGFGGALRAGLRGAVIGGVIAGATFGVGEFFGHATTSGNIVPKVVAHGVVQGVSEELNGGDFVHGFLSGAFSAGTTPFVAYIPNLVGRVFTSALIGGTASTLGGGKFSNGAISGAFIQIFNEGANSIYQYEKLKAELAQKELANAKRIDSAKKLDTHHRSASWFADKVGSRGRVYTISSGDGTKSLLIQVRGAVNGKAGIAEFIINHRGQATHQRFIRGGTFTGFPNQNPTKLLPDPSYGGTLDQAIGLDILKKSNIGGGGGGFGFRNLSSHPLTPKKS